MENNTNDVYLLMLKQPSSADKVLGVFRKFIDAYEMCKTISDTGDWNGDCYVETETLQ